MNEPINKINVALNTPQILKINVEMYKFVTYHIN